MLGHLLKIDLFLNWLYIANIDISIKLWKCLEFFFWDFMCRAYMIINVF